MARVTIDDGILTDVADAIRGQYEDEETISPLDFADLISAIGGGSGNAEYSEIVAMNTIQISASAPLVIDNPRGELPKSVFIYALSNISTYEFFGFFYIAEYKLNNETKSLQCPIRAYSSSGVAKLTIGNAENACTCSEENITITEMSGNAKVWSGKRYASIWIY